MKKTLVALAVTAFAASAYAVPVFENDTTKVDFWGSLRVGFDNQTRKVDGKKEENSNHTRLRNQGSRFGFDVKHQLGDGFYALGGVQIRFDDKDNVTKRNNDNDGFGELHARRVFVGLGKKELGQITFGEQLTLADDYGETTDMLFGSAPSYITAEANSVVQYKYQGIEGLTLGANYNFKQTKDGRGGNLATNVKNEYGAGALYQTDIAEGKTVIIEGGYGRTNYESATNQKHYRDGYELGLGYKVGPVKLVSDFGYKVEKKAGDKTKSFFVAPGFEYYFTEKARVFGYYVYENVDKPKNAEDKTHGGLLSVDYKVHKNVNLFVEGKLMRTKSYDDNGNFKSKTTDRLLGAGMRVNW